MLHLFAETNDERIQEQITRTFHRPFFAETILHWLDQTEKKIVAPLVLLSGVLVERLIVHRPHPWGLLITFIELIKNPRYGLCAALSPAPDVERRVMAQCCSSCAGIV